MADTGIGIPEDQQTLIFDSFRQQDGQSTRRYEGTGLGLAITKRLVEMMNGGILVKSTVGKGSVFELTLREVEVSSAPFVETPETVFDFTKISFERAQVLVVDDIESNRYLINELLSKVNLEVLEAENGQKSLNFAQECHPDLILMDLKMPVMDGYEATQQLKKNPSTLNIPVIALTASVTVTETAKITEHGFDGYLFKPVNTQALFNELSRYLKHQTVETITEVAEEKKNIIKTPISETIINLPVLCQVLEEKMQPVWQEITNIMAMDTIEEFAEQLIQLGEKHQAQSLIYYAENLLELAQDFEIEGVERMLEEFPVLMTKLKKLKQ